jgi:hypothetical protein
MACDNLKDCAAYWETQTLMCQAGPGWGEFPNKQSDDSRSPCGDGDMTLFNGLLCAAGDERGCDGVAGAQNPDTGEWFRSPRLMRIGKYDGATFSPDMALGVQLYLVKKKDAARASKWLNWMNVNDPCYLKFCGRCLWKGLPSFCPDCNCTVRPGDAAMLAATIKYLQTTADLPHLPYGHLSEYLRVAGGSTSVNEIIGAVFNKKGYSQHLTGVSILLSRMMGLSDFLIDDAASRLSQANPGNAFYTYLHKGMAAKEEISGQILARCPQRGDVLKPPLNQWQYERENKEEAWKSSCYWDCIFMAEMIADK